MSRITLNLKKSVNKAFGDTNIRPGYPSNFTQKSHISVGGTSIKIRTPGFNSSRNAPDFSASVGGGFGTDSRFGADSRFGTESEYPMTRVHVHQETTRKSLDSVESFVEQRELPPAVLPVLRGEVDSERQGDRTYSPPRDW